MNVLMFRHAERLKSGSGNPPLSARGRQQAQLLAIELTQGLLPAPTHLYASPKLRAQETFAPLSQILNLPIETQADLDERHSGESSTQFGRRVQNFLKLLNSLQKADLQNPNQVIYFVTHADWIEAVFQSIPLGFSADNPDSTDEFLSWAPAQSAEFKVSEVNWLFLKKRTSSK